MEAQKVDMFMMSNNKYFEAHQIAGIREQLIAAHDDKWAAIQTIQYKDPTTLMIVSVLAGVYGIDRFMLGDTGMGVGKLLTCGGFGIWAIIDWFMIMPATREKNFEKIQMVLTGMPLPIVTSGEAL